MRFLIREQEYEIPVAAGKFRYEVNRNPTGRIESWRLTEVAGGYRFLRVDFDAREALNGDSTLFHLVIGPNGLLERLKFRHFGRTKEIFGDVQLKPDEITLSRIINDQRFDEEKKMPKNYAFWFPSALGLALLVNQEKGRPSSTSVTLDIQNRFTLAFIPVTIDLIVEEELAVTGKSVVAQRYLIQWDDQIRMLWLDLDGWPVLLEQNNGLKAVDIHQIRYQS